MEVILEVWGDFACFSKPESKVERLTYPVPTPSAVRGILSSIYAKPREFVWQVNRIEVLKPIRYISFKRNEVKSKVRDKPIFTDDDRTQRQTVALRDVRYRFAASICPRPDFDGTETQLYAQALRRIHEGKTFVQPALGLKEFVAYFEEGDPAGMKPIPVDMDLGLTVYDLGYDVEVDTFIGKAREYQADIICMSAMLTTTMPEMKKVIGKLVNRRLRDQYIVMVGGAPVTEAFSRNIGADIYTRDAGSAALMAREAVLAKRQREPQPMS